MGYGYSGGIIDVFEQSDLPTYGKPGVPNARYDLIVPGGRGHRGQKQSRYTDAHGNPVLDEDFNHGGEHEFPHYHRWVDGIRQQKSIEKGRSSNE